MMNDPPPFGGVATVESIGSRQQRQRAATAAPAGGRPNGFDNNGGELCFMSCVLLL